MFFFKAMMSGAMLPLAITKKVLIALFDNIKQFTTKKLSEVEIVANMNGLGLSAHTHTIRKFGYP